MTTKTTTRLRLPRPREFDPAGVIVIVFVVAFIVASLGRLGTTVPSSVKAAPRAQPPVIVFMTAQPQPTAAVVIVERVRVEVQYVVATPTAEPQIVVAPPTFVPPAPAPEGDWYTDIATPPAEFVEALIGDDPNALACNGSVLCGGLTNAEAREAADQRGQP